MIAKKKSIDHFDTPILNLKASQQKHSLQYKLIVNVNFTSKVPKSCPKQF